MKDLRNLSFVAEFSTDVKSSFPMIAHANWVVKQLFGDTF